MSFAGQRILFIGIGFYDYENTIVARLRELGAEVAAYCDRPKILREGLLAGVFARLRTATALVAERHQQAMLREIERVRFDKVLVINGVNLSHAFLQQLRESQAKAELILYQWDSLARLPAMQTYRGIFDRALTFDRLDAVRHGLEFRPLFFREDALATVDRKQIDIMFVGWLHSDRLTFVRQMQASAEAQGLKAYAYIFTGWLTWLKLLLKRQAHDVHVRPLPYSRVSELVARSRCVLDLPHPAQSGLTMRTIDALGQATKLITTGSDIVNYDFFTPSNIRVVSGADLDVDRHFVLAPFVPIQEHIRGKYTLDRWLRDVFHPESAVQVAPSLTMEAGR